MPGLFATLVVSASCLFSPTESNIVGRNLVHPPVILAALNLASDLVQLLDNGVGASPARIQALIDLVDSA